MPEVTVVIPTYNRVRFVGRAIRSALAQTYSDIEVVVVDDGSTDDTQTQIESLAQADERVRYLRHEANRGAQAARNTGIRAARGRYIALLDSDDEWLPNKLATQMAVFEQGPSNLGVVHCGYRTKHADGQLPQDKCFALRGNIYRELLASYGLGPTSILVVKKEHLERAGLFNEQVRAWQEWDMCIRLARHCEFDYVPRSLVVYHLHDSSTISKDLLLSGLGYLDVVGLHRSEILRLCGQDVLAKHLEFARYQFVLAGYELLESRKRRQAVKVFIRAARVKPFRWKLLVHAGVAMLGPRVYWRLVHLRRWLREAASKTQLASQIMDD
jgi:glycosyltransferase involved in cell wall biosynthesis